MKDEYIRKIVLVILLGAVVLITGCASTRQVRTMNTTAYCGCGECCRWERGSWSYLKLDFWNKYISAGKNEGKPYSGRTASGTKPHMPQPGLFSMDSLFHPWMIPIRTVFFPWLLLPRSGTIAADTKYYSFGTEMYIPGYGWGVVEDRGSAIKGPDRIDLYHDTHTQALIWGRKKCRVEIEK